MEASADPVEASRDGMTPQLGKKSFSLCETELLGVHCPGRGRGQGCLRGGIPQQSRSSRRRGVDTAAEPLPSDTPGMQPGEPGKALS